MGTTVQYDAAGLLGNLQLMGCPVQFVSLAGVQGGPTHLEVSTALVYYIIIIIINPRRMLEGYSSCFVCHSVCVSLLQLSLSPRMVSAPTRHTKIFIVNWNDF